MPRCHNRNIYSIATSGGSCAGVFLHVDADIDEVVRHIVGCADVARSSWTGLFRLKDYLRGAIQRYSSEELPDKLRGNYEVSGTVNPAPKPHA